MLDIKKAKYYANYGKNQSISVELNNSNHRLSVPLDPDNTDYAEIMRQVEAGELTIEEAE